VSLGLRLVWSLRSMSMAETETETETETKTKTETLRLVWSSVYGWGLRLRH
jgi:hypothetical protein